MCSQCSIFHSYSHSLLACTSRPPSGLRPAGHRMQAKGLAKLWLKSCCASVAKGLQSNRQLVIHARDFSKAQQGILRA